MPAPKQIERLDTPDVDRLRAMAAAVVRTAPTLPALSYRPKFLPSPPLVMAAPAPPAVEVAPSPPPAVVVPRPAPVVAAPVARRPLPKRAGLIAASALAAVAVVALMARSKPATPPLAAVRVSAPVAAVPVPAPAPAPAPATAPSPGPAPKLGLGLGPGPGPAPHPDQATPDQDQVQDQVGRRPERHRAPPARAARKRIAAAPAAPEKKADSKKADSDPSGVSDSTNSELDQLVKGALAGKERRGETHTDDPPPSLPGLTRDDIMASMKPLRPKIKECYKQYKQRGLAVVQMRVGDGGEVTSSKVEGDFAGTPTGACVEAAVKSVRLPKSAGMTFRYPYPVR